MNVKLIKQSGINKSIRADPELFTMSYYLAMIGTTDNPIYESEFGTYRQGGDGTSKVSTITK